MSITNPQDRADIIGCLTHDITEQEILLENFSFSITEQAFVKNTTRLSNSIVNLQCGDVLNAQYDSSCTDTQNLLIRIVSRNENGVLDSILCNYVSMPYTITEDIEGALISVAKSDNSIFQSPTDIHLCKRTHSTLRTLNDFISSIKGNAYAYQIPLVIGQYQDDGIYSLSRTCDVTFLSAKEYHLKRGHTIELKTTVDNLIYTIIAKDGLNNTYHTRLLLLSNEPYTAEKDVTVMFKIRKSDSSALSYADTKSIELIDYFPVMDSKMDYTPGNIHFYVKINSHVYQDTVSSANTTTTNQDEETLRNIQCVLALPPTYRNFGEPCPIIMHCHGAGGYVNDGEEWDKPAWRNLKTKFIDNGYAVFDVDNLNNSPNGGVNDVGCPQLIEAYLKAFQYIRCHYNVQSQCMIYGKSFGTFSALNIMNFHKELVKCACIAGARVDYYEGVWRSGCSRDMYPKFGFENEFNYDTSIMRQYNLYSQIVTINNTPFLFKQLPPTKWLFGGEDTPIRNTEAIQLAEALKNSGNIVTYRTVAGQNHGDICNVINDSLFNEVLMFFNRYK